MTHSPEPWYFAESTGNKQFGVFYGPLVLTATSEDGRTAEARIPINICGCKGKADAQRIVAAVNFCQQLPTEFIEHLTAAGIGLETLAQWIKNNPTSDEDQGGWAGESIPVHDICIHCHQPNGTHEENCTLNQFLQLAEEWS